jgi:hypothetical protein
VLPCNSPGPNGCNAPGVLTESTHLPPRLSCGSQSRAHLVEALPRRVHLWLSPLFEVGPTASRFTHRLGLSSLWLRARRATRAASRVNRTHSDGRGVRVVPGNALTAIGPARGTYAASHTRLLRGPTFGPERRGPALANRHLAARGVSLFASRRCQQQFPDSASQPDGDRAQGV